MTSAVESAAQSESASGVKDASKNSNILAQVFPIHTHTSAICDGGAGAFSTINSIVCHAALLIAILAAVAPITLLLMSATSAATMAVYGIVLSLLP